MDNGAGDRRAALASWQPCAVLLDYDDTLLPTEALLADCDEVPLLDKLSPEFRHALNEVDVAVQGLLLHAVGLCTQQGTVQIVTAASTEWIKLTLPSLLPRAASVVRDYGISITASTNSMSSPGPWHKARAFHHALLRLPKGVRRVLSVGDGLQERVALHFVAEQQVWEPTSPGAGREGAPDFVSFKSLRLRQMPTIDSLLQQLRFLRETAMEDLLRGTESVGRGNPGGAADLYVDPVRLQMRVHSEDDRALLWAMVDAMKADWQKTSPSRARPTPGRNSWPAQDRLLANQADSSGTTSTGERTSDSVENSPAADFLRRLSLEQPMSFVWPFAAWTNHGLMCTMCTRDDGADVEFCGPGSGSAVSSVENTGQGAAHATESICSEEAFQQTQVLDDMEASEANAGLPYRTPRDHGHLSPQRTAHSQ